MDLDYQKLSELVYSKTESEVISLIKKEIDKTPKQKHQVLNRIDKNIDRLIKANDNDVHFEDIINNCNHLFDANIIKEFLDSELNKTIKPSPNITYNGNQKELVKAFYDLKTKHVKKGGKPVLECNNNDLISLFVNVFGIKETTARKYLSHPEEMGNTKPAFDGSKLDD